MLPEREKRTTMFGIRYLCCFYFILSKAYCLAEANVAFSVLFYHRKYGTSTQSRTLLFAKSRNKQAELRQKLEKARQQNQDNDSAVANTDSVVKLSDEKVKERNDRLRFEELLKNGNINVLNDYSSNGYLSNNQEEEEINAALSGIDRIFEGDVAPTDCFEDLVSIKSENAIGSTGKQRLVPWMRKNTARHDDYLVIITEPRMKSTELYETVKVLLSELPADIRDRMIIINADSPAENRRWLKKNNYLDDNINVYSDEKREFMRAYTALGDNRWSMTMFIICNGNVQKLAREIDQYGASRTIINAVKSLSEARL